MDILGGSPQPDRLPDLGSLHRFGRFSKRVWLCSAATPAHLMRRSAGLKARRQKRILFQRGNGAPARREHSPGSDLLQVQRLKKRKLVLRDRISYIEDQLTPDIIA